MDHLSLPKEFDYIVDIRVIRQPKDIIIGHSGFLLCCNRINTTISKTENSGNRERLLCRKPLCCPSVSMRLFVYNKAKNIIERFLFLWKTEKKKETDWDVLTNGKFWTTIHFKQCLSIMAEDIPLTAQLSGFPQKSACVSLATFGTSFAQWIALPVNQVVLC